MTPAPSRFGILVQAVDPPDKFLKLVRRVEHLGFDALWVADSSLHARDVYGYLTLAATETSTIRLGTGVTHPRTRHPAITGNAVATLHEISEGRAILGIGAGDRPVLELGLHPAPVAVVEKAVSLIRSLLSGEMVDGAIEGSPVRHARLMQGRQPRLPIYVAASGPRMLRLAGRVADGVLVQVGSDPRCIDAALHQVRGGAAAVGRSLRDLDVAVMLYGSVDIDRARARAAARPFAAWIPQTVPAYCDLVGIAYDKVAAVRDSYKGGELLKAEDAAAAVTEEMIDAFTLAGTPEECSHRVEEVFASGADTIIFFPMGEDRLGVIERFAAAVMG